MDVSLYISRDFKSVLLVLASASQARHRLLTQSFIPHHVIVSGIDERNIRLSSASALVQALAIAKAEAVIEKLSSNNSKEPPCENLNAVLGCDSVFEFEGEIFGKPRDAKEAKSRLERFSSKSGYLYTGHALFFSDSFSKKVRGDFAFKGLLQSVISTRVEFSKLNKTEIEIYVETGEPIKSAGGFTLEGMSGMFISRIEGCYSNVLGLSLPWLRIALLEAGI